MACLRCAKPLTFTSGFLSVGKKDTVTPDKEDEYSFLGEVDTLEDGQLTKACTNMLKNAAIMRGQVKCFLERWKYFKDIPVPVMVLKNNIPVLKLTISAMGGSALVTMVAGFAEKLWGSVLEVFVNVVNRSCMDVKMSLNATNLSEDNANKLIFAFGEMHNALEIATFDKIDEFIPDKALQKYISERLSMPLKDLSDDYAKVLVIVNLHKQMLQMEKLENAIQNLVAKSKQ